MYENVEHSHTSVYTMAAIQNRLLGRGTDSMAHKNISTGRINVIMEAEIIWLRIITKKQTISDLATKVL